MLLAYLYFAKVLDEMFKVLLALEDTCTQPRTHELLQELRDISSMAMEHFEEKIVPKIKQKISPVTMALTAPLPVASPAMTPGKWHLYSEGWYS